MTPDTLPALTPYPRPNHVRRLRQERERRRGRIGVIAAAAVGLVAIGGGTAAFATDPPAAREASQVQLATGDTANRAQSALDAANALLERADADAVDTSALTGYVDYLEGYEQLPAAVADDVTEKTDAEIASVSDDVTAYEKEQAEQAAREKEQAEQAAREKREAEEAAAAAAEAQAAANTVEGAKSTARDLMASTYGWGDDQFACLDSLWTKESGWNYQASNPSSGAYGIPQSLPGSKMSTVADDWETNATTQITWGLDYISRAYGMPCSAWGHSQAMNWY